MSLPLLLSLCCRHIAYLAAVASPVSPPPHHRCPIAYVTVIVLPSSCCRHIAYIAAVVTPLLYYHHHIATVQSHVSLLSLLSCHLHYLSLLSHKNITPNNSMSTHNCVQLFSLLFPTITWPDLLSYNLHRLIFFAIKENSIAIRMNVCLSTNRPPFHEGWNPFQSKFWMNSKNTVRVFPPNSKNMHSEL